MEIETKATQRSLSGSERMDFEDDWTPDYAGSSVSLANPLKVEFTNQDYKS